MATRKDPGGGKKPPRKPVSSVAKPKAKVTKSRGSNTATQVGNDNQRERYNQGRGKAEDKLGWTGKVTKREISAPYDPNHKMIKNNTAVRKSQRSGGKGK